MTTKKILLSEDDIPRQWYNLAADLPSPLQPPLGPDGNPISPDAAKAYQNWAVPRPDHQSYFLSISSMFLSQAFQYRVLHP